MKNKPLPALEYLNECFILDSNSPSGLTWKIRPESHFTNSKAASRFNKVFGGEFTGETSHKNYFRVFLDGSLYPAHRIIYALYNQTIDFQDFIIDHINRDPSDNTPANLRKATKAENNKNFKLSPRSQSGVHHVSKTNSGNWLVRLRIDGKDINFGTYKTIEDAAARAREVSLELYKEFSPFYPPPAEDTAKKRAAIRSLIPSLNFRFHPIS